MQVNRPPEFRIRGAADPETEQRIRKLALGVCLRLRANNTDVAHNYIVRNMLVNGWAVTITMNGALFFVDAYPPGESKEGQKGERPLYYSGIVYQGRIAVVPDEEQPRPPAPRIPKKLKFLLPSHDTARDNAERGWTFAAPQPVPELSIEPALGHLRDKPKLPPVRFISSQYKPVRATQFTGLMRKVVQYQFGCPQRFDTSIPGWNSSSEPNEPHPGAVPYDFSWDTTHGIYRSSDGTPWVVEVSAAGVRVWLLGALVKYDDYTVLYTANAGGMTAAEYEAAQRLLEDSMLPEQMAMLELVGFLPLNEPIPGAREFDAMVAAGTAFKPLGKDDLAGFYAQGNPYFPHCGWAFDQDGAQCVNTGWAEMPTGWRKARYAKLVIGGGNVTPEGFVAVTVSMAGLSENWLTGGGRVYVPHPPTLGDLPFSKIIYTGPTRKNAGPPPDEDTDNVVYAYFDGKAEVRIRMTGVRKAAAPESSPTVTETGSMNCGVGSTMRTVTYKWTGKPSGVYTTHHDDRKLPEGGSSVHTVVARFGGWNGSAMVQEPGIDCWGFAVALGAIITTSTHNATVSRSFGHAVHIPHFDREAYFYSSWEHVRGKEFSQSTSRSTISGGVKRLYYTYDPFWIHISASYMGMPAYTLLRAGKEYKGTKLVIGPLDGNPAHIYKHYAGQGWVECDPPLDEGGPCDGPPAPGPVDIEPQPRNPPAAKPSSRVPMREHITTVFHRSGAPERRVAKYTQDYPQEAAGETIADWLAPYIREDAIDSTMFIPATCDVFEADKFCFTPPYWNPVSTMKTYGDRQAFTTTPIGFPYGLPT